MTTPAVPPLVAVPAAQITVVDIFAKTIEMQTTLVAISEQLKAIPDHEARIRSLERWKYSLPTAMFAGLGSLFLSVWAVLHAGG